MTRTEFLGDMLKSVFGVKYLELKNTYTLIATYIKGGSFLKDCTYTMNYKKTIQKIFGKLLDEKIDKIFFKKDNYGSPEPIDEYREKAKKFIFDIKIFNDIDSERLTTIKENMTTTIVNRIYQEIIIEEIFNIGDKKGSKERQQDNFDESVDNINKSILAFINREFPEIVPRKYKNDFFKKLIENYPVFSELELEEDNKIVQKHIQDSEQIIKNTFGYVNLIVSDAIDLIEGYKSHNDKLSAYNYIYNIEGEIFFELQLTLQTLCMEAQGYNFIFQKEEVIIFKNIAVSIYNHFYGKHHQKYDDVTNIAAWNAHEIFIDYIFILNYVLKSY